MQTKRGIILTLLVLSSLIVLALVVAGCGGSTTATNASTTSSSAATATSAATASTTGSSQAAAATASGKMYHIGITQIVTHPALDAAVQGFIEALAQAGYVEGKNVTFDRENAQGDESTATAIAQKFASENLDLIFSVATPSTQAVVKATTKTPIVFAAVTDPVAAGIVNNPNAPDANVTGCSDLLPVQPHLDLIKELVPNVKTIGLLYNAGETNSVTLVTQEKAAAKAMGLQTVEATVANSSDVLAAAQSLVGRVQAISVLTDNTVVSALASVVKVCEENKIPLIAGDGDSVKAGAVAAYAFDYHQHGIQAGEMAVKVLQGTPISQLPVEYAKNLQLSINLEAAAAMGVTIPDSLKAKATTTY